MHASTSSKPTPAGTPASAIEKQTPGLKSTGLLGYPALRHWPELAPAIAVHTNLGLKRQWARLRVPVKLMREAGMHPERGVQVATHGNRVLIWGDARGGQFQQCAESKGFPLVRNYGVPKRITNRTMALVQGPDYLIVTTMTDALKLAAQVEVHEHEMWRRMGLGIVSALKNELCPNGIDVRGWSDFTLCLTRPGAVSRTASVAGPVWWLAGFVAGDAIRFTRYRNATVVEKCTEDARHSVLVKDGNSERPRHYVGSLLCDIANADKIRAIALPGRLILTTPETNIGRLCDGTPQRLTLKELLLSNSQDARQDMPATPLAQPTIDLDNERRPLVGNASPLSVFAPGEARPATWKAMTVLDGHLNVYGRIWSLAGFAIGDAAHLVEYHNALVAEKCDAASAASFRVGSPSQDSPYHDFSLKQTLLRDAPLLRVIALPGRLVLTRWDSDLAALCEGLEQMPVGRVDVERLLQRHGLPVYGRRAAKHKSAAKARRTDRGQSDVAQASRIRRQRNRVKPVAAVEVGCYSIPEGKRLQMQGKWLQQFGFAPGLKYRVVPMESELQLELVGEGGMTVTEHSPGRAKLYVPTETLKPFSCPTVKVLAGEGRIRLVPATV
jgi:hypothetical protein